MFAYIGIALCTCCLPGAEASAQEQAEQRKVEPASEVAIGAKWGRPVAGLQAGMRLASGSTRVLVGDRVKLHLVLRNTTDRAIRVAWANNQGRYGWRVRRTGKTASDHVWAIAPRYRYWQEERLVPPVAGAIGFRLGARSETAIPMEGPELLVTDHIESKAGATTVVGKPGGIIRLRALPITAAARGEEWLDQLETGELTLQVVASETEAPAQAPKRAWSPEQATGEPDTPQAGDYPTAWASLTRDDQDEWLMLEYAEPVVPTEVRVYETYNPGALNKVSVFTEEGREVVLWTGEDPTPVGNDKGVSKTALRPGALRLRTKRVKLYIASRAVPGWNEIDAVALVGRTADRSERVQWAASATASSTYADCVQAPLGLTILRGLDGKGASGQVHPSLGAQAPPASQVPARGNDMPLPALAAADVPKDIAWGPGLEVQAGVRMANRYGHQDQHTGLYVFAVYVRNLTKRTLTVACPSFSGLSVPADRVSYTTIIQTDRIHCTPHIRNGRGQSVDVSYRLSADHLRYRIGPGQAAMVSHWMLRVMPSAAKGPDTAKYTQVAFVEPGMHRVACDVNASWGGRKRTALRTGEASFEVTAEDVARPESSGMAPRAVTRESTRERPFAERVAEAEVIVVATLVDTTPAHPKRPGDAAERLLRFRAARVLKGRLAHGIVAIRHPSPPVAGGVDEIAGKEWLLLLTPEFIAGKHQYAGLWTVGLEPEVCAVLADRRGEQ